MTFQKIIRTRSFWIAVFIGLLGAASYWVPMLGILIAALTIIGAWMQGYENVKAAQEFTSNLEQKHQQAIATIEQQRDKVLALMEKMRKEERNLTKWATRLLVGIVWTFNWFGYDRYIKRWVKRKMRNEEHPLCKN